LKTFTKLSRSYELSFDLSKKILLDENLKPSIEPGEISTLTLEELDQIKVFTAIEMRRKDKNEFINWMGDEQTISLLKELMPVFYEPLVEIYSHANMPEFLGSMFKFQKKCINAARDQKLSPKQIEEEYTKAAKTFEVAIFRFVHHIVEKDSGTLEAVINWGLDTYNFSSKIIVDVMKMVEDLDQNQRNLVLKEIEEYFQYKNKEKMMKSLNQDVKNLHSPPQTAIPLLCPKFLELVKPALVGM